MSETALRRQIETLSARVTALTMLLEALYVERLSEEEDPAATGEGIIRGQTPYEAEARQEIPEGERYNLKISGAFSSLIDRAVLRALSRRSRGRQT